MTDQKASAFDPKVNPLEVHVADMQRALMAVGQIVRTHTSEELRTKEASKQALKKRLEALVASAQAALTIVSAP